MALDSQEKRASAIDPGVPSRVPGVDPTREGFDEQSRAGAAGMYSGLGGDAPASTSMNNPADSVAYGVAFAVAGAPCSLPAPLLRL
jgi:hypothetical protein